MSKTIVQKVVFKNTSPKTLYDLYMDPKKHSAITSAPAKISNKVGSAFSAHNGYITGKNIHLIKDHQIVQTWRGKTWPKEQADSTFIINLEQKGKDTILHAIHTNIPEKEVAGIEKGWHGHYWKPMKQYLAGKPITRPKM
jgi:activator of HSP90 ATPase